MTRGSLRLGVIGCGHVFERLHLPAILRSREFQLTSVCDPDAARRTLARDAAPGVSVFADADSLLDGPSLDAVLVCTPPDSHAHLSLAALDRDLHVLVEKPLATSSAEARDVQASVHERKRQLLVGYNRRFRRTYQALRDRAARESETRGEAVASPRMGFTLQADAARWKRTTTAVLDDLASHQLDLVCWLSGRKIREVRAAWGSAELGRQAVTIQARLEGDVEAVLHAGYGDRYRERLEIELPSRSLAAHPAVLIDPARAGATLLGAQRLPLPLEHSIARLMGGGNLILRRALGRPSLTLESVERQLSCFAARIRTAAAGHGNGAPVPADRWIRDGADEGAGLQCAEAVEACARSLDADGQWTPVSG